MMLPAKLTSLLFHNCPYWILNSNELSEVVHLVHVLQFINHVALLERKCLTAFLGHAFAYVRGIIRFILTFFLKIYHAYVNM